MVVLLIVILLSIRLVLWQIFLAIGVRKLYTMITMMVVLSISSLLTSQPVIVYRR